MLFSLVLLCNALAFGTSALTPSVWPEPSQSLSVGTDTVELATPFSFTYVGGNEDVPLDLAAAFARYEAIFFPHPFESPQPKMMNEQSTGVAVRTQQGVLSGLTVSISDQVVDGAYPSYDADESYNLTIQNDDKAKVEATTLWGALRALETVSQLINFDYETEVYTLPTPVTIVDTPAYKHRGLLIDAGRHFEPIPTLLSLVDGMAYAKLNVLHWHLTEDQSFPMPSSTYPELPSQGAYNTVERYTKGDVQRLVEYARQRGIRVIPEFDMPGHTSSWRNSHPEIFAAGCLDEASRGAFDPAENATFQLLSSIFDEWFALFPDQWVHLGSDEVPSTCWNNTKDLEWMQEQGLDTFDDVFAYFVNEVVSMASEQGKSKIMLWDEAVTSGDPDPSKAVIQIWHGGDTLPSQCVDEGFDFVLSAPWYLDHLATNWTDMYQVEVPDGAIGGEGCMWGETVDPSDLESTVWPRLAAVAERLWTNPTLPDSDLSDADARIRRFRCLLLSRGVRAGLVSSIDGRDPPPGPGACDQ